MHFRERLQKEEMWDFGAFSSMVVSMRVEDLKKDRKKSNMCKLVQITKPK